MSLSNFKPTTLTTVSEQEKINHSFATLSKKENLLPIKVTAFFQKKIAEEISVLKHTEGPLHRIVYPSKERMQVRAPFEVADFVDDRTNMPTDVPDTVIRKYKNRILFLPTSTCAAHCQYCFRQDVLSEQHENEDKALAYKLDLLETYLQDKPEIKEVILSGGDPMTLSMKSLTAIITRLKNKIGIESIRIHTKTISYSPSAFKNVDKLKLLGDANVRLVFHTAHPYEICSEVEDTIHAIQSHGIRCYNQFPLLRNINDHSEVLIKHLKKLDSLNIRNLSIFIPDPINYSATFRVSLPRLFELINEFNWRSPSWINSTRFVLDTPIGKVRREDIVNYDKENCTAIFKREGQEIIYPDLPEHLDIPGNLDTLLWKG